MSDFNWDGSPDIAVVYALWTRQAYVEYTALALGPRFGTISYVPVAAYGAGLTAYSARLVGVDGRPAIVFEGQYLDPHANRRMRVIYRYSYLGGLVASSVAPDWATGNQ